MRYLLPSNPRPTLIATLLIAALAPTAFAQSPAQPPTAAFEVATVKPNTSGSGGSSSRFRGDLFVATNVTLKNFLQYQAFNISGPRIVGAPKWIDSERFDMEAKMDSATAAQLHALNRDQRDLQLQSMFQQVLADRFQLKTHWEDREMPIYALVVAKGGPNLEPAKKPELGSGSSSGNGMLQGNNVTLTRFAEMLTQEVSVELGRVVVDETQISGTYDMMLKWTPETNSTTEDPTPPANAGPTIFTAVQEQLGLKLDSTKGPVKVLVIDHVEMPSEN
jgi:uncharacterized protein (TIGR03435 family)